jgi:hypothetical protein
MSRQPGTAASMREVRGRVQEPRRDVRERRGR